MSGLIPRHVNLSVGESTTAAPEQRYHVTLTHRPTGLSADARAATFEDAKAEATRLLEDKVALHEEERQLA